MVGIVLAGGKSTRMGHDKGLLGWHGIPQRYYLADLLQQFCGDTLISCRQEQAPEISGAGYKPLVDAYENMGPMGAIVTAMQRCPNKAFLIVACDLPLIDSDVLLFLITNRNASAIATTYESPHDSLPEPLITIWEPVALPVLLQWMNNGYKCPRKVLINTENVTIIQPEDPQKLTNANTPEDAQVAQKLLAQKSFS